MPANATSASVTINVGWSDGTQEVFTAAVTFSGPCGKTVPWATFAVQCDLSTVVTYGNDASATGSVTLNVTLGSISGVVHTATLAPGQQSTYQTVPTGSLVEVVERVDWTPTHGTTIKFEGFNLPALPSGCPPPAYPTPLGGQPPMPGTGSGGAVGSGGVGGGGTGGAPATQPAIASPSSAISASPDVTSANRPGGTATTDPVAADLASAAGTSHGLRNGLVTGGTAVAALGVALTVAYLVRRRFTRKAPPTH
jgi:hypothetical protein